MRGLRKLTDADVLEIRKIYQMADRVRKQEGRTHYRSGMQADIAARFGVTGRTIRYIITRKRRKSVMLRKKAKA